MNERRLPRTENEIGISRNLCILSSQRAHGVVIAREIEKLLHRATLPLLKQLFELRFALFRQRDAGGDVGHHQRFAGDLVSFTGRSRQEPSAPVPLADTLAAEAIDEAHRSKLRGS